MRRGILVWIGIMIYGLNAHAGDIFLTRQVDSGFSCIVPRPDALHLPVPVRQVKNYSLQAGLHGGFCWAGVKGSLEDKTVYSPVFRIYGVRQFSPFFSWYGGIDYNRFGYRIRETIQETGSIYEQKHDYRNVFSYIHIPVLIRFSAGERTRLYLEAGISAGGLIHARMKGYYTHFNAFTGTTEQIDLDNPLDGVKFLDFGFRYGGGLIIPLSDRKRKSNYSLICGFNHYAGLPDILREDSSIKLKNRAFYVDAGLLVSFD